MTSNPLLIALGAGIGALAMLVGLYVFINRRRIASDRLLRERLGDLATGISGMDSVNILRGDAESVTLLDRYLKGKTVAATIEEETRRAGLNWSAGQFAGFVLMGLAFGLIAGLFVEQFMAILIGVGGSLLPFLVVSNRKKARLKKIEEQLPDAVDMLVNSLRAGYSLQAGMNFVGTEMPAPVGTEFARFYDEQRLGMDVRQALQNLTERLGTLDVRMVVLAILIQRETGGNLSEILGNISTVIRERINFRGQLDVLTSESKMSAIMLSILPLVLYAVIRVTNPSYVSTLTETDIGKYMLMYGTVSLIFGYVILRNMATIEV